jgi:hypothetical protein
MKTRTLFILAVILGALVLFAPALYLWSKMP